MAIRDAMKDNEFLEIQIDQDTADKKEKIHFEGTQKKEGYT